MKENEVLNLIDKARGARDKAYAPYSDFKVGAALIDNNDIVTTGVNVENGSYGLTNCAERSAVFSAVAKGMKSIKAIAIIADTSAPVSPCGACRQVISEFCDENTSIILANMRNEYKVVNINDILPYKFKL